MLHLLKLVLYFNFKLLRMTNKNIEIASLIKQLLTEQNLLKKEVLTFTDAAIYLGTSASRLNRLTANSEITHYVPYPGRVVYRKSDLDAFLLRNKKYALHEAEKNYNYAGGICL